RARYGNIAGNEDAWRVVHDVVQEVVDVARAANVRLVGIDDVKVAVAGAQKIAQQMPEAMSSTGQDMMRGKRTEIDSLNGYIARRGAQLGVPTPVNRTLWALVKLAEGQS
ncbi:MAG TPA: ketopantoate reductase C-terminal domain-containing protein, partial [Polyangiaceae bacterium]|nr:ketopantoate reductase C-terminal domain-containing protein [Polyangiaceae bacterium]